MNVRYFPRAERDLEDIWVYIAADNKPAAQRTLDGIIARLKMLGLFPTTGRERPELGANVRSYPINQYVIFYTIVGEDVLIMRVLHGHRDVTPETLKGSESVTRGEFS